MDEPSGKFMPSMFIVQDMTCRHRPRENSLGIDSGPTTVQQVPRCAAMTPSAHEGAVRLLSGHCRGQDGHFLGAARSTAWLYKEALAFRRCCSWGVTPASSPRAPRLPTKGPWSPGAPGRSSRAHLSDQGPPAFLLKFVLKSLSTFRKHCRNHGERCLRPFTQLPLMLNLM